ncbi:hypothetical protein HDU97_001675 [Phlyctochytrium planicorne]|nr:hypothetical protein HDU97_001675 [Phlyctochytrium planicorne]
MKRKNSPASIHSVNTELIPFLKEQGIQSLHALSLQRFFTKNPKASLDDFFTTVPNLPEKLKSALEGNFVPFTTTIDSQNDSSDGSTTKLGIKLQDGQIVETVIMRYDKGEETRGRPRNSVCISSQIGCKMGCTFCATGAMGLKGHLTAGEIVEQFIHATVVGGHIDNVVFMGMGEPLDNYDAVLDAIKTITEPGGIRLAPHKICVSTVGVIPRMRQIIEDAPDVRLALSLHAPTQDIRLKIVPTAKAYPINQLMEVVDEILAAGRQLLIEYILIKDLNDTPEVAERLGNLLGGARSNGIILNLILYNPTDVEPSFEKPTEEAVDAFERTMTVEFGIKTKVRRTMGDDIYGACGQLAVKSGEGKVKETDLEDMFAEKDGLKKRRGGPASKSLPKQKLVEVKDDKKEVSDGKSSKGLSDEDRKQIEEEAEEGLNELKPAADWSKVTFPLLMLFLMSLMAVSIGLLFRPAPPKEPVYRSPFLDRVGALPQQKQK